MARRLTFGPSTTPISLTELHAPYEGSFATFAPEICIKEIAACPYIYAPVCGFDGVTYANECVAEAECVTEWTEGECR